ncbi:MULTISPECIES: MarR family winged helix-turn-helix transcriptional regulator [Actinomadura]|uniref:DNA-binding transcriptional regulator, MarR family n=1 Tax=Actinomadura madurae TaxID=1993 RepID=A0A1I5I2L7_9ACTN|nr:MarR family transcriptional regulator [Actinomadura madurae]SFO54356.1 DNA-binding transcriptional regulator, MarR family [Actinomadura madurae]SPT58010.1 Multidrug resistance operon repressor [Actinomadura madurae]
MSSQPSSGTDGSTAESAGPNLVDGLAQLSFHIQKLLADVGAPLDLSVTQLRLLGILRDRDPEMLHLAIRLGLDKSSVTGLVSRAEKRGLVQRMASPRDRRAVIVTLTPEGRRVTHEAEAQVNDRINALLSHLSPAEQGQLTVLVAQILHGC